MIVNAIKAIAVSDLGFSDANGNVKDYLIDFHQPEEQTEYLIASVGGQKRSRAWAVDVRGDDEWYAINNVVKRAYLIQVVGYYEQGQNGEGVNALIDGARKIRGAIRGLSSNLSETVNLIESSTPLSIDRLRSLDGEWSEVLRGVMTYTALRVNPDF